MIFRRGKNRYYRRGRQTISLVGYDLSDSPVIKPRRAAVEKKRDTLLFAVTGVFIILCLQGGVFIVHRVFGDSEAKKPVSEELVKAEKASEHEIKVNVEVAETKPEALAAEASYIGDPHSGYGQLVNRSFPIKNAASYYPSDLEYVSGSSQQMRSEAAKAMEKMIADFKAENPGLPIYAQSGFRTFDRQKTLYNNQINRKGKGLGSVYSAIPGTSEHELGLAMDLSVDGYTLNSGFADKVQGKWFSKHCTEYGYILRYPKDKQKITGIIYEPWHFRYVGVDIAKDMAKKGITTLEEYYGLYLNPQDIDPYLKYLE